MFSCVIPKQDLTVSPLEFILGVFTEIFDVTEVILHNTATFTGNVQFSLVNEVDGHEIIVVYKDLTGIKDFIWCNEPISIPAGYRFKVSVTGDIGEIEGTIIFIKR